MSYNNKRAGKHVDAPHRIDFECQRIAIKWLESQGWKVFSYDYPKLTGTDEWFASDFNLPQVFLKRCSLNKRQLDFFKHKYLEVKWDRKALGPPPWERGFHKPVLLSPQPDLVGVRKRQLSLFEVKGSIRKTRPFRFTSELQERLYTRAVRLGIVVQIIFVNLTILSRPHHLGRIIMADYPEHMVVGPHRSLSLKEDLSGETKWTIFVEVRYGRVFYWILFAFSFYSFSSAFF
jgi:hypothetical protein